ncbi:hypothetical protein ACSQ67_010123 [Phaseolus vulgaris]
MEAQENDSLVVETEPSTSHAPGADDSLRQSSDVLARGLSSMLSAVITDFDCRAHQTLRSQDHLSSVLDRLTGVTTELVNSTEQSSLSKSMSNTAPFVTAKLVNSTEESSLSEFVSNIAPVVATELVHNTTPTVNIHPMQTRSKSELDQLLEDAPLPFIMQHAAKISSVRKRVSSLNSLLKSIQGRIDNIDRMISIGTTHACASACVKLSENNMSRFTSLTTVSVDLSAILEPWINHGVIVMVILLGRPEASRLLWPDKESGQYPPYA